jgi:hypothetical protein
VESGQGTISDLRDMLNAKDGSAYIRAAVHSGPDMVRYIDVIAGPPGPPPGWEPRLWEYQDVSFLAAQVPSRELAATFSPDEPQPLRFGRFDLTLPALSPQLPWQRKPGRARYDSVTLPWPSLIFEPQLAGGPAAGSQFSGLLIGDDCPSFPSYEAAFRAFFCGDFARLARGGVPSGVAAVRVVDDRAWLEQVRVTPASVEIQVRGTAVGGTRVELNGETYRCDARATPEGRVVLPLPDGLPLGAWLYLSRGGQWLDYRAIGDYSAAADLAAAGVEVEATADPGTEIGVLLSRGEGLQLEFKRQLPGSTVEEKRTVFKTVAAFANGYGGIIVFGVESDEATVCGLGGIDLVAERDRLAQLARAIVTPSPEVEVRSYDYQGQTLLVLEVSRGSSPPYGITLPGRQDKPVEFYIRRDATTFPARADEVRSAVLAAAPTAPALPPWATWG